jgi:hypothetical protein
VQPTQGCRKPASFLLFGCAIPRVTIAIPSLTSFEFDQFCQIIFSEACVRELQILVDQKPPQGVLERGHAGLVINKHSQELNVPRKRGRVQPTAYLRQI